MNPLVFIGKTKKVLGDTKKNNILIIGKGKKLVRHAFYPYLLYKASLIALDIRM